MLECARVPDTLGRGGQEHDRVELSRGAPPGSHLPWRRLVQLRFVGDAQGGLTLYLRPAEAIRSRPQPAAEDDDLRRGACFRSRRACEPGLDRDLPAESLGVDDAERPPLGAREAHVDMDDVDDDARRTIPGVDVVEGELRAREDRLTAVQ